MYHTLQVFPRFISFQVHCLWFEWSAEAKFMCWKLDTQCGSVELWGTVEDVWICWHCPYQGSRLLREKCAPSPFSCSSTQKHHMSSKKASSGGAILILAFPASIVWDSHFCALCDPGILEGSCFKSHRDALLRPLRTDSGKAHSHHELWETTEGLTNYSVRA